MTNRPLVVTKTPPLLVALLATIGGSISLSPAALRAACLIQWKVPLVGPALAVLRLAIRLGILLWLIKLAVQLLLSQIITGLARRTLTKLLLAVQLPRSHYTKGRKGPMLIAPL